MGEFSCKQFLQRRLEGTFLDVLGFGANSCGDGRGIMRLDSIGDNFHGRHCDCNSPRRTCRKDTTRFTSLELSGMWLISDHVCIVKCETYSKSSKSRFLMFLVLAPTPAVMVGALCVLIALVTTFTAGTVTATRLEEPVERIPPGSRASKSLEYG